MPCLLCAALCLALSALPASATRLYGASRNPNIEIFARSLNARATSSSHGVLVEWTSGLESDILGFNVIRIVDSQRTRLNPSLIAGPTLIYGARTQSYAWFDANGTLDSNYEVESVDLRGEEILRGIAEARRAAALPAFRQSPLLAHVDGGKSIQIANAEWHDAEKSKS